MSVFRQALLTLYASQAEGSRLTGMNDDNTQQSTDPVYHPPQSHQQEHRTTGHMSLHLHIDDTQALRYRDKQTNIQVYR